MPDAASNSHRSASRETLSGVMSISEGLCRLCSGPKPWEAQSFGGLSPLGVTRKVLAERSRRWIGEQLGVGEGAVTRRRFAA